MHLGLPPLRRSSDFSTSDPLKTLLLFVYVPGPISYFSVARILEESTEVRLLLLSGTSLLQLVLRAIEELLNGFDTAPTTWSAGFADIRDEKKSYDAKLECRAMLEPSNS